MYNWYSNLHTTTGKIAIIVFASVAEKAQCLMKSHFHNFYNSFLQLFIELNCFIVFQLVSASTLQSGVLTSFLASKLLISEDKSIYLLQFFFSCLGVLSCVNFALSSITFSLYLFCLCAVHRSEIRNSTERHFRCPLITLEHKSISSHGSFRN